MRAELQAIADAVKARRQQPATKVVTAPAPVMTRTHLETELRINLLGFDPAYQHSDDYTYYCVHDRAAQRIATLRREIAALTTKEKA